MSDIPPVQIGATESRHAPLGLGGTTFGPHQWSGQEDANLLAAMETSLEHGITHFDTAEGYGDGYSEHLIGRFMAAQPSRRSRLFLASKANVDEISAQAMLKAVDGSLARLQTDMIDLYYIHWPRTGQDLRPWMEGLETARQQGKIRAIGVSNFSVEQMEQIAQVGRIDAHQLNYSLLWRFAERDLIPYCAAHQIAVVTYASLAHGILAGKFARDVTFPEGDQRRSILLFREDVWPAMYEATEAFKATAERSGRSLIHLAIRWLLHQRAVTAVLVGARSAQQALANAQALDGTIPASVFDELTTISDHAQRAIPDEGNPYGYHP
jgi:myo-inositol catabolism protein IolS